MNTNPIWDLPTDTFDLLSAKPFENLVREGVYREGWLWVLPFFPKNGRYQDLGTRILVPGSWYQDVGTRILVPRCWYQDPGSPKDLGTKILVPESWYQDPGTKILGTKICGVDGLMFFVGPLEFTKNLDLANIWGRTCFDFDNFDPLDFCQPYALGSWSFTYVVQSAKHSRLTLAWSSG